MKEANVLLHLRQPLLTDEDVAQLHRAIEDDTDEENTVRRKVQDVVELIRRLSRERFEGFGTASLPSPTFEFDGGDGYDARSVRCRCAQSLSCVC